MRVSSERWNGIVTTSGGLLDWPRNDPQIEKPANHRRPVTNVNNCQQLVPVSIVLVHQTEEQEGVCNQTAHPQRRVYAHVLDHQRHDREGFVLPVVSNIMLGQEHVYGLDGHKGYKV